MLEQILTVNPRRRKRRHRARHANPRRRHRFGGFRMRRRRHHNPRGRFGGVSVRGVTGALVPALMGAGGAILLDVGMAYIPLPAALASGWGKTLAQIAGALGLGFIAGKVVGHEKAKAFTLGALTIVSYNTIKPLLASTLGTSVQGLSGLADFKDYQLGAYMQPRGMGAYMNPAPMLSTATRRLSGLGAMGAYMPGARRGDMSFG